MKEKPSQKKQQKKQNRLPLNIGFLLSLVTSLALSIAGFFVPPMGVIDGSVLTAIGLLLGFGTVALIPEMIQNGHTARVNLPAGTSVEVKKEI